MKNKTEAQPQAPIAAEPTPLSPAKVGGIKKVNLGGIAKTSATTKIDYPVLTDESGGVAGLVADILAETDQLDALKGSLEIKKAELKGIASTFFFKQFHGQAAAASSVEARSGEQQVLVQFQNRYKVVPDEAPIVELLGEERVSRYFKQAFELKISGDKIPADKADQLVEEVMELFQKHGASAALTAAQGIKPTKDFHAARHTALTVEENARLELICPIIGMVKTKGRGEDKEES